MKKILFLLTLLLSIVSISACQMVYECAPVEEWSRDETNHWHVCFIEGCDEKYDLEEHSFGEWEVVDEAVKSRSCEVCGYVEEAEIEGGEHVHAPSNEWSSNEINHWHTCDGCTELLDKAAHDWDEGEVTTKPTEQAAGVKTYTCETCGKTKEEDVPQLSHTHTPSSAWASDETNHWHTCGGCSELLDKAAHNWDDGVETTPATETEKGVMTFTCETCGKTKTQDIPELNHTHTPSSAWASDDENHWHACGGCSELLDKAAHDWDAGQVTSDPTEDAVGVKTYTCETCGKTKEEEVPKLEHTHVYDSELKGDVTGHWIECKCGEKEEVLDHSYGAWTDKTDTQERTCSECGYIDSRTLTDTWDGSSVSASLLGSGTEADPYQIHSAADLAYFRDNAANISHVKLMRNIDLAQSIFMIPSFNGTFDGNKYSITVNFTDWSDNGVAFFKVVEASGIVKNLTLKGSCEGWAVTGGIVAILKGKIINCVNWANVSGKWSAGGVVSEVYSGSVEDCYNYGTIKGALNVGGIVGLAKNGVDVTGCYNYGSIEVFALDEKDDTYKITGTCGAGVVGFVEGNNVVSGCYNEGTVKGVSGMAGIVGGRNGVSFSNVTVQNCTNKGNITTTGNWCAGIVAVFQWDCDKVLIDNCTNKGAIKSEDWCAGGIVAAMHAKNDQTAVVSNCTNEGTVFAKNGSYAGIVGCLWGYSSADSCTNTVEITGGDGICATDENEPSVTNCQDLSVAS